MRVLRWFPSLVLLVPWLLAPTTPSDTARIRDVASPHAFSLLDWETAHLVADTGSLWAGLFGTTTPTDSDAQVVRTYFRGTG